MSTNNNNTLTLSNFQLNEDLNNLNNAYNTEKTINSTLSEVNQKLCKENHDLMIECKDLKDSLKQLNIELLKEKEDHQNIREKYEIFIEYIENLTIFSRNSIHHSKNSFELSGNQDNDNDLWIVDELIKSVVEFEGAERKKNYLSEHELNENKNKQLINEIRKEHAIAMANEKKYHNELIDENTRLSFYVENLQIQRKQVDKDWQLKIHDIHSFFEDKVAFLNSTIDKLQEKITLFEYNDYSQERIEPLNELNGFLAMQIENYQMDNQKIKNDYLNKCREMKEVAERLENERKNNGIAQQKFDEIMIKLDQNITENSRLNNSNKKIAAKCKKLKSEMMRLVKINEILTYDNNEMKESTEILHDENLKLKDQITTGETELSVLDGYLKQSIKEQKDMDELIGKLLEQINNLVMANNSYQQKMKSIVRTNNSLKGQLEDCLEELKLKTKLLEEQCEIIEDVKNENSLFKKQLVVFSENQRTFISEAGILARFAQLNGHFNSDEYLSIILGLIEKNKDLHLNLQDDVIESKRLFDDLLEISQKLNSFPQKSDIMSTPIESVLPTENTFNDRKAELERANSNRNIEDALIINKNIGDEILYVDNTLNKINEERALIIHKIRSLEDLYYEITQQRNKTFRIMQDLNTTCAKPEFEIFDNFKIVSEEINYLKNKNLFLDDRIKELLKIRAFYDFKLA